ncbi:Outer membrane receptor proteins, mostly Fe transport [Mucilaginibacter mallensis]|uniref:Outer membrane receptor proteins, mostly Fe transport n=1 Tax=Mucilaginibacter mallensis TaxID=652787 RepID=A0A1H2ABV2_MUCMA|nr:TonB-dependent receptor [Mucilaginibacter mallensis]SDT42966.1 Outer membrane receptor proteins, mostly Fe transport [Mucilaginibacter mallensis]
MKRSLLFILCLCLLINATQAASSKPSVHQQANGNITGTVVDKAGQPILGATITIKGDKTAIASSDKTGKFTLTVAIGKTLVITAVSYKPVEVVVADNTALNVVLVDDLMELNTVVVTGSTNPVRKLEASVALTSFGSKAIEQLAPTSTADLLKHVPGFLVEASGGEVGNNLFARGIPAAGGYQFVTIEEDGMPVFEDGELQFGNADNWIRVDETTARLEAVRGGSGSIFANNAPGGLINFISKTGTDDFAGTFKLSTGTDGLFRTDLNLSGPLIKDKLFYDIGGFYRVENGVRDPGYKGNDGGQVKMNLKYVLDSTGYVKVSYKHLDDKDLFLLPIPLTGSTDPKGVNGFNPNTSTFASSNYSQISVPQLGGGYFTRNLEDGIHPIVNAYGMEFNKNLGSGFSIDNNMKYTNINMQYTAIFPGDTPQTGAAFAASNSIADPLYTNVNTGAVVNPAYVANVGFWAINKQMENFANNMSFSYKNKWLTVSAGYYYSSFTSNQYWNWSNILVSVEQHPQLLNLVNNAVPAGSPNSSVTYNGITDMSFLTRQSQFSGTLNDFFGDAQIKANPDLTFDLGLRYSSDRYNGYNATESAAHSLDNNTSFGYDFTQTTADNSSTTVGGPYYYWKYKVSRLSTSLAANYKISEDMSMYARYSNGFRSPDEATYYSNATDLSAIKSTGVIQYELGYKYESNNFALFANGFYMTMDNIPFNDVLADGTSTNQFAGAKNIGVEIEGEYHAGPFNLTLNATIQNPTLTNFSGTTSAPTATNPNATAPFDYNGNSVERIPKFYGTIRPGYNITKNLLMYVELDHFGQKYADNANLDILPKFDVLNAGLALKVKQMRFALDLSNITNTVGLTEGNPRITTASGPIYYARPIEGRFGKLSAAFNF